MHIVGGGAGNKGGIGRKQVNYQQTNWEGGNAENGTGGLLIIYAQEFCNNSKIESNGSKGGGQKLGSRSAGGGGSGGGSINIFYKTLTQEGTMEANGGTGGVAAANGGNGGNGSVTTTKIDV